MQCVRHVEASLHAKNRDSLYFTNDGELRRFGGMIIT